MLFFNAVLMDEIIIDKSSFASTYKTLISTFLFWFLSSLLRSRTTLQLSIPSNNLVKPKVFSIIIFLINRTNHPKRVTSKSGRHILYTYLTKQKNFKQKFYIKLKYLLHSLLSSAK